jgi:predicted dienelactone hydrolase
VVKSGNFEVNVLRPHFRLKHLGLIGRQRGSMFVRIFALIGFLYLCGCQAESSTQTQVDRGLVSTIDFGSNRQNDDSGVVIDATTDEPDAHLDPILGFRSESFEYMPMGRETVREIPIYFWYPASERTETTALYKFFPRDDVFIDAPTSLMPGAPLLLFSHGRRGFGEYSYFMCEFFAKQGWLVAAIDHVGDRVADTHTPEDIYSLRPQDISAMLDHINDLPEGHPLRGIASEQVALAGHSFGGYTTFVVAGAGYDVDTLRTDCDTDWNSDFCLNLDLDERLFRTGFHDPRVKLAIPMAAGNNRLYETYLNRIHIPVLMITGARDTSVTELGSATPIWNRLMGAQHRRVQFHQGGHFTFTNICSIIGPLGEDNGCDDSFIPPEQAHPIVNAYVAAFVQRHFFGDESGAALIDGIMSLHDDVQLMRKE